MRTLILSVSGSCGGSGEYLGWFGFGFGLGIVRARARARELRVRVRVRVRLGRVPDAQARAVSGGHVAPLLVVDLEADVSERRHPARSRGTQGVAVSRGRVPRVEVETDRGRLGAKQVQRG